jgi:hypothetical protein
MNPVRIAARVAYAALFGGLIGAAIGLAVAGLWGGNAWLSAGALSVAAPFVQVIGRLRGLVQGCCHGRECDGGRGIVVRQERSRVVYLAHGESPCRSGPIGIGVCLSRAGRQ